MVMELKANDPRSFLNCSGEDYFPVDIMDPMYKMFLEHLRKDGKSYILEMDNGDNGLPVFVKYENNDELSDSLLLEDAPISSGHCSIVGKGRFKTKKSRICRKSEAQCNEIVEFFGPLSSQVHNMLVADSTEQFRSFENRSTDSLKNQAESNLADDSYQEFLSCLKIQDGLMVMEYNSVKVIYEASETSTVTCFDGKGSLPLQSFDSTQQAVFLEPENEGPSCSDNRELVLYENNPDPGDPDVVIYEADDMSIVSLDDSISSSFDSKLTAVLSVPYDEQEHELLWEHANFHKPVLRHKDLRSQSKSFSTRQMGFSYLDHFPDLARKLEHSEPQQALNLLRGLFFWLKNLCHEGAYQPWMPASSKIVEVLDLDIMLHLGEESMTTQTSPSSL